jgi:hypothetical protein
MNGFRKLEFRLFLSRHRREAVNTEVLALITNLVVACVVVSDVCLV